MKTANGGLTTCDLREIQEYSRVLNGARELQLVFRQVLRRHGGCHCTLCDELRPLSRVLQLFQDVMECDAPVEALPQILDLIDPPAPAGRKGKKS